MENYERDGRVYLRNSAYDLKDLCLAKMSRGWVPVFAKHPTAEGHTLNFYPEKECIRLETKFVKIRGVKIPRWERLDEPPPYAAQTA